VRRLALIAAVVALVAAAAGVVDLPDPERLARSFGSTLGPYTYALVGVMAFLETGAAVGLIAPGELIVILGGVAAGQREVELTVMIALVWACAVAGDLTSFAVGRRVGRDFLLARGHRVRLTPERLARVERYFARHGGKTILAGRFVGLVRSLAPVVAGASEMPARRFVPATVLAAGVWAAACTLLGYFCWASVDDALALAKESSLAVAAVAAVAVAVVLIVRRRRARRAQPTWVIDG